ncbi:hypothetical protein GCM10018790_64570 [Kitasatospora xanthocidica]|uniref:hypothetical protein n=1 Tax=Kitasatospora xanthocidica TaxID=83382 RepID=UPI001676E72B|nr:hypothetical protein [Kitasatospora xanthocidica]GHF77535.1 hypothetical protein GCM10018790_64570 [Kitasatospora xanthocidica]
MSEHEAALAVGAAGGLGRYRGFAVPKSTVGDGFLMTMGLLFLGASSCALVLGGPLWSDGVLLTCGLFMGLGMAGPAFWPRFERRRGGRLERRRGGRLERLHCFEDGLVIGSGHTMRPIRWSDVTITSEDYPAYPAYPGSEYHQPGTSRTLTTPDGTVVARFTGQEPERVGGYQVMLLHQAATEREAVHPSPGPTPSDARPTEA